jgi:hypothetical protein
VTTPGRSNISVATSGTATGIVVEYAGRNFFLYHNGLELASVSVTAQCATGSNWNDSICIANALPTIDTPTATNITSTSATLGARVTSV